MGFFKLLNCTFNVEESKNWKQKYFLNLEGIKIFEIKNITLSRILLESYSVIFGLNFKFESYENHENLVSLSFS